MYESFYGLNEKPFNLTPDPRFFYLSIKHKEAFAHLLYGIRSRSGFVMVSGEIGTGKTTICRSLLKQLDHDTEVAFIFNPKLSPIELLRSINSDFGVSSNADSVPGLVDELNGYLLEKSTEGKNCVLIIDEAQNLGTETLEQVRLLSNLETETAKLLQIVLIGQPELGALLELPELRQLNQRITARYHLEALNEEETLHYIAFRLRVAGGERRLRFTRRAVRQIYRLSKGTPRVINALSDRALLIGFTKEVHVITPALVKQASREISGSPKSRKVEGKKRRLVPASVLLAALVGVILGMFLISAVNPPSLEKLSTTLSEQRDRLWTTEADASIEVPEVDEGEEISKAEPAEIVSPEPSGNVAMAAQTPAVEDPEPIEALPEPEVVLARIPEDPVKASPVAASPVTKSNGALSAVLAAWEVNAEGGLPSMASMEKLHDFATDHGLRFARMPLSLEEVTAINLPAILRVKGPAEGAWLGLVVLNAEKAETVSLNGERKALTPAELKSAYAGDAVYLWPQMDSDSVLLREWSAGSKVHDLQDDLYALGLLENKPTGVYDSDTLDAVTKVQHATGLAVDGVVGPRTRMVIHSWLSHVSSPSLAGAAFPVNVRLRVLSSPGMSPEVLELLLSKNPTSDEPVVETGAEIESVAPSEAPTPIEVSESEAGGGDVAAEPTGEEAPGDDEQGIVSSETLDEPEYRPLLSNDGILIEGSLTTPASQIVPIVPRENSSASEGSR